MLRVCGVSNNAPTPLRNNKGNEQDERGEIERHGDGNNENQELSEFFAHSCVLDIYSSLSHHNPQLHTAVHHPSTHDAAGPTEHPLTLQHHHALTKAVTRTQQARMRGTEIERTGMDARYAL